MSRINEIILDKFQSYAIIDIKWSAQMNQYQKKKKRSKLLLICTPFTGQIGERGTYHY